MQKGDDSPKTAAETLESVLTFVKRSFMFWKRATLVFLLVAGLAYPMVFLKARIYRSEVVVLYQENIKAEAITGGDTGDNARRVGARLREMLLSRASLEPIVNQIPRYASLADRRGIVDAVEELRGHIAFKSREGDAFEISYESPDPKEAQDITQRLGQRIVDEAANQRLEQSKATKDFLDAQSKQNKAKLDEANAAMAAFIDKHPEYQRLLLPGAPAGAVPTSVVAIPTAPPGTKDPTLFAYEAEARNIEKQLRAGKGGGVEPAPAREESEEVKAAKRDLAALRQQGYTEQHPDVVAAKRKLQAALDADAKRAPPVPTPKPGGLSDSEREQLENRLKELRRLIVARRTGAPAPSVAPSASNAPAPIASSANVALDVEFRRLQRDVEYLKDAQRQLDDKLFKAGLTAGANVSNGNVQVKILDPAYLPVHPVSKPRSTMLAMYLAAAGFLAALVALISARLDDRIYLRNELEMLDILPVVGVIPRAGRR